MKRRMRRESHVRCCESLEVRFLRATRQDVKRRHALNNQLTGSSQTCVAHRNLVVIGYYTLVYGNISLDDPPPSIREGMPSAFPVPVMVFARWAVDQNEQNKGIGRALLKDAFLRTAAAADIGGLRAILVDAFNEKMVMEYKKLGFIECPVGELRLWPTRLPVTQPWFSY